GPWNVQLTIDGGQPTGSDTVIFGTPGVDNVIFTPTGPDSATVNITNLTSVSNLTGVEHVVYNGISTTGLDNLTIIGIRNDTTNCDASTFLGSFSSIFSPTFAFSLVGRLTVNDGAGFNVVNITGSSGDDTVTSTANAITVAT